MNGRMPNESYEDFAKRRADEKAKDEQHLAGAMMIPNNKGFNRDDVRKHDGRTVHRGHSDQFNLKKIAKRRAKKRALRKVKKRIRCG